MAKVKIVILGSTGSIGINTLELASSFKDNIEVIGLSADRNIDLLQAQIEAFRPTYVAVRNEAQSDILQKRLGIEILPGLEGLKKIASLKAADIIVVGISGAEALAPILEAIKASKRVALANKEALVMAGRIITQECKKYKAQIIPVDSEHSAIFQCLENRPKDFIRKLIITSSGGPLIDYPKSKFPEVSPELAVKHPRWNMGKKISVDSATLMNKALEIIEARWLFDMNYQDIEVIVHREAIVHSMVEFIDGTVFAQLGVTDMRLPILYALSYPKRWSFDSQRLDFSKISKLSFEPPDVEKFGSLKLASEALKQDGTLPCVLNAANEEAVKAFLSRQITFDRIVDLVEKVMLKAKVTANPDISQILEADKWAREATKNLIKRS